MKRIILVILVVALLAVIGAILYMQIAAKPQPVDEILPAGPVGYVRVIGLEEQLDDLTQSDFWKALMQIDFVKVMEKSGSPQKDIDAYKKLQQQLSSSATHQIVQKFFGKEVAIGIYPPSLQKVDPKNLSEVASNIIVVTRLSSEAKFVEFFTGFLGQMSQDISVESQKYKKRDIHVISFQKSPFKIGYVRMNDLFVFGMGDNPARRCIDVVTKQTPPLARDAQYTRARAGALDQEKVLGYLNFDIFVSGIREQVLKLVAKKEENAEIIRKQLDEKLRQIQGFKTIVFSAAFDAVSKIKFDVHFDKEELDPEVRPLYECPPAANQTLAFIPADILGYQWSACYDFDYYWQQAKKDLARVSQLNPEGGGPQAAIASVEQRLNLNIENDILPALGDELGGYLADVDTQGFFPIPKLVFFVKIDDRDKAETIMTTLIEQQAIFQPSTETYEGTNIKYINIPLVINLEPAYAFVRGYLLLSTSRQAIKDSLDAAADASKSLSAGQRFQGINQGMTNPNNAVVFLEVDRLMGKVGDLIEWASQWSATQMAKQRAFIKGSEQRLNDIKKNIGEWQSEIQALETELQALQVRGDLTESDDSPIARIETSIERTGRFIQKMEESLAEDKGEERRLVLIQEAENMALPPEGEKRLVEVRTEIEKKENKIAELKAEQQGLEEQKEALRGDMARIEEIQRRIEGKKNDILSAEGTEKELTDIIATYEAQAVDPEKQRVVVEEFLKPLVRALAKIRVLALRTVSGEGILEFFVFFRGE